MAETFLALLTAHLLADFIFQTDWMVARKGRAAVMLLHIAIVSATTAALLGALNAPIIAITAGTHFVFDQIKLRFKRSLIAFLLDQAAHVAVAWLLAYYWPNAGGAWARFDEAAAGALGLPHIWRQAALCVLCGLIASVRVGGVAIALGMARITAEIANEDIKGLERGGRYIGWLERALVMLLALIGQPAGVGFLITAKSILRFGDAHDSSKRKLAEYIIIGTFLSFGWGILIAELTVAAIRYWAQSGR